MAKGDGKVDAFVEIAYAYRTSSPDSVSKYAKQALKLSKVLNYVIRISNSYKTPGLAYSLTSRYDSALFYYQEALKLIKENSNIELEADILMGIGGVFYYQSQLDKSSRQFIDAAKIYENLNRETRLVAVYSNIGNWC